MILLRDSGMVVLFILLLFLVSQMFQITKGNKVFQVTIWLGILGFSYVRDWSQFWHFGWNLLVLMPSFCHRVWT